MHCDIYRSSKKTELYVYIARTAGQHRSHEVPDEISQAAAISLLSDELRAAVGKLSYVMHLDLTATPKLARAPIELVKQSLRDKGYFIQLPPEGLINPAEAAPEGLRGA